MEPSLRELALRDFGKFLLVAGIVLAAAGALLMASLRLPFRLGRLPGDVAYSSRHGTIYFPIVTCILLSVLLTLVLRIVNALRR
jgi:hypothetical protein